MTKKEIEMLKEEMIELIEENFTEEELENKVDVADEIIDLVQDNFTEAEYFYLDEALTEYITN